MEEDFECGPRVGGAERVSLGRVGSAQIDFESFTDPRLCAAIVDRLTFNGTIIQTGTDSYRLNPTRLHS